MIRSSLKIPLPAELWTQKERTSPSRSKPRSKAPRSTWKRSAGCPHPTNLPPSGMSPQEAAHRTMDEVGGALISIALTLCAVFVPSAFLSGISGLFFGQFAVTIAASTAISCFVSLTLSPALCAALFEPHDAHIVSRVGLARRLLHKGFDRFNRRFEVGLTPTDVFSTLQVYRLTIRERLQLSRQILQGRYSG